MLVLSRKKDESIVIEIEQGINIKILEVKGDNVKIGIDAPPHIRVFREEVIKKIAQENLAANKPRGASQPDDAMLNTILKQ